MYTSYSCYAAPYLAVYVPDSPMAAPKPYGQEVVLLDCPNVPPEVDYEFHYQEGQASHYWPVILEVVAEFPNLTACEVHY